MNYWFLRKDKYLRISKIKESMKYMNYLKNIDYGDLKFIVNSTGLEMNLHELKDSEAFLDNIKNVKCR